MSKFKKGLYILVLVGVVGVSVVATGNILTKNRFARNTTFNGQSIGYKTVEQVNSELAVIGQSYKIRVYGRNNNNITISSNDIDMSVKMPDELINILNTQNSTSWPIRDMQETSVDTAYTVEYDKDKLAEILNNTDWITSGSIEPVDAYISKELDNTGNFYIVPEVKSDIINIESLVGQVDEAISNLSSRIDIDESVYKQAKITSTNENLIDSLNEMNSATEFTISYDVNGKHLEFNKQFMLEYISIDDSGKVIISSDASSDFIDKLNKSVTTMGLGLNFTTTLGETKWIPGGNWGWWLDWGKTKERLDELIAQGEDAQGEVYWRQECPSYGESEFTNYVEIDLGNQHLYLYKSGELIGDWDITSGLASDPGKKTPEGIYALTYKQRDAILRGPGYASPVEFWMPFNGNIGMHDAPWKSVFGGNYYLYSGSHGCINMPRDGAETVYNYIDKTYAIICYY